MFIIYCIVYNSGRVKLRRIDCSEFFGEENVGEFTITNISYFSGSGIWLGKILVNDVRFTEFATKFPSP